ncbi:MAG: type IV secretory system conjugative DNA transfer family protein [Longimicrobiales bacterium]
MQTLSALAEHTARFHEWELSGRGWQTYPHLVPLEPTFRPFEGHRRSPLPSQDDGRRHTVLSAFWERLTGKPSPQESAEAQPTQLAAPIEIEVPEEVLEETEFLLPPDQKAETAVTASLLRAMSAATEPISFELVGREGRVSIRFASSPADTRLVRSQLATFFPAAELVEPALDLVQLWRRTDGTAVRAMEFGLAREFMLPLADAGKAPDPLTPFIAALAEAGPDELAVLQVLFTPARAPWAESASMALVSPDGEAFFIDSPQLTKLAEEKFSAPLYAVLVRVLVRTMDEDSAQEILRGVTGALKQFSNPDRNSLTVVAAEDPEDVQYNILLRCTDRSGMLLSLRELAGLVRIPGADVRSPALVREVEVFPQLPEEVLDNAGVVLGVAQHEEAMVPVRLSAEARMQHMYVIGASGTGKSTLLENLILQDIASGHGVGVLDPHGDLVDEVLGRIPDGRIEDVVLFDPADPDWVVGWNILGAHSDMEKELLTSDLVAVFKRLSTSWGDQMSAVLGNAVLTFLESRTGGTLIELRRFLLDDAFRKAFLGTVADEHARIFWREEFPLLAGKKPQAPILTRLNTLLRTRLVREAVVEREKALNFREIMDGRKIFLAKLSQGAIGEENAALLGSLLVSKFHQVALTRQDTAHEARTPFFLFADEFQNVATPSMASLFSGVRKYKLALCVAHQDLYQLHSTAPELERSILANAYSRILFRVSEEDARKVERGMGEYTAEDLVNLSRGEAVCRVGKRDHAFRLDTVPLPPLPPGEAEARRTHVRNESLRRYGRPRVTPAVEAGSEMASPSQEVASSRDALDEGRPKGRGGRQHKYLQSLLRRVGEDRGFRVTTEETVLDGHGHVDVSFERNGVSIGCEISVSTSPTHELNNLSKCLAAGFDYAVLVSAEERTLRNAERTFLPELPAEQRDRVHFLTPDAFIKWLEAVRVEAFSHSYGARTQEAPAPDPKRRGRKRPGAAPRDATDQSDADDALLLDAEQAAAYLHRAPQTLAKLRCVGGGPPYYKVGRNVFYKRPDLDAWLDGRRRRSTSDKGGE